MNNSFQTEKKPAPKIPNAQSQPLAWVEKGEIKVSHPKEGPFSQVVPCRGVELTVNGKVCHTPTTVKKDDQIQLKTLTETRPGKLKIKVSKDKMLATLNIKPKTEIRYEVEDIPPSKYLKLKTKENYLKLPPATLEEILGELAAHGITTGIDRQNCLQAAGCHEEKEFVVARGTPCEPGEDARLEILFSPQKKFKVDLEKEKEEKKVDFRQRFIYNCVEEGAILAKKTPPVVGKPGISVLGKFVNPPVPKDIKLIAGKNVRLNGDGNTIYAVENGLPGARISGSKAFIEVVKVLFQNSDVDISSGNVDFKGDVVIQGNVHDTMTIKATGNVEIARNVTYATVYAAGSITVRNNVISSNLISGGKGSFIRIIIPKLRALYNLVNQLEKYILSAQQNPVFQEKIKSSPATLIRFSLQDTKFKLIPAYLKEIKTFVNKAPKEVVEDDLLDLIKQAEKTFFTFQETDLKEIKKDMANLLESLMVQPVSEENIEISYALNSDLKATGMVKVVGSGCFNTKIDAGSSVEITKVFRGGEIRAKGNVKVGELGSSSGVKAKIITGANSSVFIKKAWENAEVQIGQQLYRFLKKEDNVRLKLDEKGIITYL